MKGINYSRYFGKGGILASFQVAQQNSFDASAPGITPPSNLIAPTIGPEPANTGDTLSIISSGSWSGDSLSFSFQWYQNNALVSGETGSAYLVPAEADGAQISCIVTATNSGGSDSATSNAITPTTWDILSLSASLTALYDERNQELTGGEIGTWRNQVAPQINLTNANTNRPYSGTLINSLNVVEFRSAEVLNGPTLANYMSRSSYHIFAVANVAESNTNNASFPDSNDPILYFNGARGGINVKSNGLAIGWHDQVSGVDAIVSLSYSVGTTQIYELSYTSSTGHLSFSVGSNHGALSASIISTLAGTLIVGGGTFLSGQIASIAFFNQKLSEENRTKVRNYLSGKWNAQG